MLSIMCYQAYQPRLTNTIRENPHLFQQRWLIYQQTVKAHSFQSVLLIAVTAKRYTKQVSLQERQEMAMQVKIT